MKKLTDRIISIVCCIAMVLITCFGVSYKVAHKTYADATPTTKQTIGMWFTSLLASMGARIYITSAQGYEWIVDNFNEVMRMANLTYTLGELVEDAQERYNEQSSSLTLPEMPSKAISIYLENLWNNGFRQDSTDYDMGNYTSDIINYYVSGTQVKQGSKNYPSYYVWGSDGVRFCFTNRGNGNFVIYAVANTSGKKWIGSLTNSQPNINNGNSLNNKVTVNGNTYYYSDAQSGTDHGTMLINYCTSSTKWLTAQQMVYYTFGEGSTTAEEIQVYGDGTLGLDDMVNTADRDKDVEIDYNDLLGAEAGAKTFAEVMEKIRAILEGEQEGAIPQAEVIVKTIVPVPGDVPIPLIFEGLPEIVKPECETLGACLVSGVQTVSQHLQNVYNSNSSVANYTMVSLAIGVALYILTGGI